MNKLTALISSKSDDYGRYLTLSIEANNKILGERQVTNFI